MNSKFVYPPQATVTDSSPDSTPFGSVDPDDDLLRAAMKFGENHRHAPATVATTAGNSYDSPPSNSDDDVLRAAVQAHENRQHAPATVATVTGSSYGAPPSDPDDDVLRMAMKVAENHPHTPATVATAAGKTGSSSPKHSYRLTIKRKALHKQNHSGSATPKRNCIEDIIPSIMGRLLFWGDVADTANDDFPDVFSQRSVRNDLLAWLRNRLPEDEQLAVSSHTLAELATKCSQLNCFRTEPDPFCRNAHFIRVLNGVVDLSMGHPILRDPREGEKFDCLIQANFIPGNGMPSLAGTCFEHYCRTSLGGDTDKMLLLLELTGYTICNTVDGKSIFIFIGAHDCGKSVIIKFVMQLFTLDKITAFTFNECEDQRNTQQLSLARLNVSAENDENAFTSVRILKACSGGDFIEAGRCYHDSTMVKPYVHFLFSANEMPANHSADTSDALYRRLRPLIFDHSIPPEQQDNTLLQKLLNERDAIVTASIWALSRVMHDPSGNYPFTVPQSSLRFMADYKAEANSVRCYIADNLEFGPDKMLFTSVLHKDYIRYCIENGFKALGVQQLIRQIKQYDSRVEPCRHKIAETGKRQLRGLSGVGLK